MKTNNKKSENLKDLYAKFVDSERAEQAVEDPGMRIGAQFPGDHAHVVLDGYGGAVSGVVRLEHRQVDELQLLAVVARRGVVPDAVLDADPRAVVAGELGVGDAAVEVGVLVVDDVVGY